MEKRERRDRYRRNQVLNQRHGRKEQPGPTDKSDQPVIKEKKVIDHTAIPDPNMFDNLKRETDDIAALTDRKYSGKRQIFSNWAKYETPPEEREEEQPIGADYDTMIQSAQIGSQFQFRSERSWDPKHLPVQSAAFTIDLGVLSASLACLPLYEKLLLPLDVFSNEELEHMERQARFGREAWKCKAAKGTKKEGLPIWTLEKLTDISSDKITSQLSSMAADSLCDSGASEGAKLTPDGELAPEQAGEDPFDFGAIPTRGSTEVTSAPAPLQEDRPPVLSPKQRTPESVQLELKQQGEPEAVPEQPLPRQRGHEQQAAVVGATNVEEDTKEAPKEARKKSRGGKNKAGKRRSWGPDQEESPATSATATPQPQADKVKKESPRKQPAQHQLQHITKEDVVAPCTQTREPSSPTERQTSSREETVKRVAQVMVPKQMPLQQTEEKREQRKPAAEPPASAHAPLHKEVHKNNMQQRDKTGDAPPQTTAPPDDQLDFLLSLRKPIHGQQVMNFAVPTSAVRAAIDEDEPVSRLQPPEPEKKTEDLEDWLDSMLDD